MAQVDRPGGTQPLQPPAPQRPASAGKAAPIDTPKAKAKTDSLHVSVDADVILKDGKPAVQIRPVKVTGSAISERDTAALADMSAKVRRAVVQQIVQAVVAQVGAKIRPVVAAEIAKGLVANQIDPQRARLLADEITAGAMPEVDKAIAEQIAAKLGQ